MIDPYLSHCTTELMRTFESMTNRFQSTRKELEVKFILSFIIINFIEILQIFIKENELLYTRQQELDILLGELERHLNYLTINYETFESIQKDNRREIEIKLDKHQVK